MGSGKWKGLLTEKDRNEIFREKIGAGYQINFSVQMSSDMGVRGIGDNVVFTMYIDNMDRSTLNDPELKDKIIASFKNTLENFYSGAMSDATVKSIKIV